MKNITSIRFCFNDNTYFEYRESSLKLEKLLDIAWSEKEKDNYFHKKGKGIFMVTNGFLVGEALWAEDSKTTVNSISTIIHKPCQGKGYGKLLRSFMYQYLKMLGYKYVTGTAKSGSAISMIKSFGAKIYKAQKNLNNSGNTYYAYKQKL